MLRVKFSEDFSRKLLVNSDILDLCGQTEAYLKDMGMTGLASAWAIARRRPI